MTEMKLAGCYEQLTTLLEGGNQTFRVTIVDGNTSEATDFTLYSDALIAWKRAVRRKSTFSAKLAHINDDYELTTWEYFER